jgi:hypothetical protein
MWPKSEYKWGDVCGKNEVEGEEERAFSEEDAKSRILTGTAPPDSLQANAEKTAEKAGILNAEGQKLKRAAEKKQKEDEVTRKKRKALEEKKRIEELSDGAREAELPKIEDQKQAKKKASQEKLAAAVKTLDPGRSGRGRNREQSATAVAVEHGNFR